MRRTRSRAINRRSGRRLPAFVSEFLSTDDGLALFRAFIRLPDGKLRRALVELIKEIASDT